MMGAGKFTQGAIITFGARVITLVVSIGTSIIIARVLGPEGKGIYALAAMLPALIVTFTNLGIGPATTYFVAGRRFPWAEILGSDLFLASIISAFGVMVGLLITFFFKKMVFNGVPSAYLIFAVALIPGNLFMIYTQSFMLGTQRFKEYNLSSIAKSVVFSASIIMALIVLDVGIIGVLLGSLISFLVTDLLLFRWARVAAVGVVFKPNRDYIRQASSYGAKSYLANVLGFLNYRVDILLVNIFLNPTAVGLYSVSVGLVEQLWLVSQVASTVLFPRVAAETNGQRKEDITPLVARTVLWLTALGALVLLFLSRWIVLLLYSDAYLPSVKALQMLLVGIVSLSTGRVFANDIAGRGHPMLNTYIGIIIVVVNVILNITWIPKYGIVGAAAASTVAYTVAFGGYLYFYSRLSGNSWVVVLLPQQSDWVLYWKTVSTLWQGTNATIKRLL